MMERGGADGTVNRIALQMIDAINETSRGIDYDQCLKIAEMMIKSSKICSFGVGNSAITAMEISNVLARIGIMVTYSADHVSVVEIEFSGYENILIWHPHGSRMVCIEPWQCLPSYVDEIKEFAERDGVVCLPAGSEITLTRVIKY